ncbi:hypothetical protein AAMO2058_000225400 [Amorphochlora amoebiformis]
MKDESACTSGKGFRWRFWDYAPVPGYFYDWRKRSQPVTSQAALCSVFLLTLLTSSGATLAGYNQLSSQTVSKFEAVTTRTTTGFPEYTCAELSPSAGYFCYKVTDEERYSTLALSAILYALFSAIFLIVGYVLTTTVRIFKWAIIRYIDSKKFIFDVMKDRDSLAEAKHVVVEMGSKELKIPGKGFRSPDMDVENRERQPLSPGKKRIGVQKHSRSPPSYLEERKPLSPVKENLRRNPSNLRIQIEKRNQSPPIRFCKKENTASQHPNYVDRRKNPLLRP